MKKFKTGGTLFLTDYFQQANFCLNIERYTDKEGCIIVDRVIYYENLNRELGQVFNTLGIPFDGELGVKAKGNIRKERKHYRDVFTDEQNHVIKKVFEKEIALHGYHY